MSKMMTDFFYGFQESTIKPNLKMAVQRMQIASNKKSIAAKHLKREIATLLQENKDEKARIKVEHVIREDFMIESYELLQLLCDLTHERIRYIASQKECPPDLLEAISSIVWATNRVEIEELKEVRNQFKLKYGNDFIKEADENVGSIVNARLFQKLSVQPPSTFLVVNYLKEIAKEYNVDWTHTDFGLPEGSAGLGAIPSPVGFSVPMAPGSELRSAYQRQATKAGTSGESATAVNSTSSTANDSIPAAPQHKPTIGGAPIILSTAPILPPTTAEAPFPGTVAGGPIPQQYPPQYPPQQQPYPLSPGSGPGYPYHLYPTPPPPPPPATGVPSYPYQGPGPAYVPTQGAFYPPAGYPQQAPQGQFPPHHPFLQGQFPPYQGQFPPPQQGQFPPYQQGQFPPIYGAPVPIAEAVPAPIPVSTASSSSAAKEAYGGHSEDARPAVAVAAGTHVPLDASHTLPPPLPSSSTPPSRNAAVVQEIGGGDAVAAVAASVNSSPLPPPSPSYVDTAGGGGVIHVPVLPVAPAANSQQGFMVLDGNEAAVAAPVDDDNSSFEALAARFAALQGDDP